MSKAKKAQFVLLKSLDGKNVQTSSAQGAGDIGILDISKARNLGNGSFGTIDTLCRNYNYTMHGLGTYSEGCKKAYYEGEDKVKKAKKAIMFDAEAFPKHSNVDVPPSFKDGKAVLNSEQWHLNTLIERIEKFNNRVFQKSKEEKMFLKELKSVCGPATVSIYSTNYIETSGNGSDVKGYRQLSTREKKLRSVR
jgi:hypothetical protein